MGTIEGIRISVAMVTYNGAAYLRAQIGSILSQLQEGDELVVSDDGSVDGTVGILKEYQQSDQRVRLLEGPGRGLKKNVEHAIAHTRGEYIFLADQDDIWMPDKVRRTLHRMKQLEARYGEAQPALVFTDAEVVNSSGRLIAASFCKLQHLRTEERSLAHLLMENVCQGCTMMLNDALARKMRLPEPEEGYWPVRYHDWWTALTAAAFGCTSYLPEPTMQYRLHGSNVVGAEHFGAYVKRRAADWKEQRRALEATWKQAEAFRSCCKGQLDGRKQKLLDAFCRMPEAGRAGRIGLLLKYRFFKSGLIRNIGLLLNLLR